MVLLRQQQCRTTFGEVPASAELPPARQRPWGEARPRAPLPPCRNPHEPIVGASSYDVTRRTQWLWGQQLHSPSACRRTTRTRGKRRCAASSPASSRSTAARKVT
eukprot:4958503-Pyramimonas_sp.AAC.1